MATIEQATEALQNWAISRNLYNSSFPIHPVNNENQALAAENFRQFANSETLLKEKNIIGFAYNQSAKIIYVLLKKQLAKKDHEALPKFLTQEYRVEYIQANNAQAQQPGNTASPYTLTAAGIYTCGSSIHPARHIGSGTLGCLVKNDNGEIFGISNNHVTGNCNFTLENEQILAPGHVDIHPGMIDPFTIGHHVRSAPFISGVSANVDVSSNLDAAMFKIADPSRVSSMQGDKYDTPDEIEDLQAGYTVYKVGRTTGYTTGYVQGMLHGEWGCNYTAHGIGPQLAFFHNVFLVNDPQGTPFSLPGDSGSLVVADISGTLKAVGIVFAGDNQGNSYVLPIRNILQYFNVQLVRGHNI
ncbi:hypothetical protein [Methylophilus sp. TWE2]|uniref:hypothetical protein n=1 Tax=Methylophilus sp. TWE2 TaxID=1662285 RepID=UPI00067175E4|nr:hypothetical protein [Methylophilus sp. TWE2]